MTRRLGTLNMRPAKAPNNAIKTQPNWEKTAAFSKAIASQETSVPSSQCTQWGKRFAVSKVSEYVFMRIDYAQRGH